MAEANAKVIEMLQKLSQRFDSHQKEVETLKESDARRSANSSPPREAESSDSLEYKDRAAHRRSSGAQEKAKRRKRRHRPRSTRSRTSRSRSRSRSLAPHSKGKSRARRSSAPRSARSWTDRRSDSESGRMDYVERVVSSDTEAEYQPNPNVMEVSETTAKFLQDKCTRRLPNSERREARDCYPVPKVLATRTPQLDPFMRPPGGFIGHQGC